MVLVPSIAACTFHRHEDFTPSIHFCAMFEFVLLGNPLWKWVIAIAVTVGVTGFLKVAQRLAVSRLRVLTRRTKSTVDDMFVDMLAGTKLFLLFIVACDVGIRFLILSPTVAHVFDRITVAAVLLQGGFWGAHVIRYLIGVWMKSPEGDEASVHASGALGVIANILLWALLLLLFLDNLGFDVTALITGLGIGGIAVALAVQNILSDLFASLSIVLDKPFLVGDAITVDEFAGTVEHIGLKTTRVRSYSGEQIVISNNDLLKSRIRNFKRMEERRVLSLYTVSLDLGGDILAAVPSMLREAVNEAPPARFDRAHLRDITPAGIVFELVYYIPSPDFNLFMECRQNVHIAVVKRFAQAGVPFARPRPIWDQGAA
ncbi:MAG: mechanosensitive ion channel family protein [Bacteroidota bacterium]|nr:mechanosensitive ion channel family protein [Bacteroidota bacterium]